LPYELAETDRLAPKESFLTAAHKLRERAIIKNDQFLSSGPLEFLRSVRQKPPNISASAIAKVGEVFLFAF
jgi:hypothetical protein